MSEGTRRERYRIEGEIGRGAMGIVYRAYDNLMERYVAFKVLSISPVLGEGEREGLISRFLREAQAAGRLSGHPRIVTTHDVGKQGDIYFIAMELIEGEPLTDLIERGLTSQEQALDIMLQLCDAMDFAHSKGIIHRDLKPDNIFVTDDGQVKIADFGIARVLFMGTVTEAGTMVGTPGYMSPEQVRGGQARPASDIFSAGVILYELLTGVNPFEHDMAELSYAAILYRIVHEQPPPPQELQPGMQPGFEKIIKRAMEKEPAARYESFGQFLSDLTLIARGLPGYEYHVRREPLTEELVAGRPLDSALDIEHLSLEKSPDIQVGEGAAGLAESYKDFEKDVVQESEYQPASEKAEIPSGTPGPEAGAKSEKEGVAPADGVLKVAAVETRPGDLDDNGEAHASEPRKRVKVLVTVLILLVIAAGTTAFALVIGGSENKNQETESVEVPDLTGLTTEEARSKLEGAGLEMGEEPVPDDSVPEGQVLGQDPEAGTSIKENSIVAVRVAIRSRQVVPDVKGLSLDEAIRELEKRGLNVSAVLAPTDDQYQKDKVMSQAPAQETMVDAGTVVSLVIGELAVVDGSKPDDSVPERITCTQCGGSGVIRVLIGEQPVMGSCPDCGGDGVTSTGPCQRCNGTGQIVLRYDPVHDTRTCPSCNGAGYIYK